MTYPTIRLGEVLSEDQFKAILKIGNKELQGRPDLDIESIIARVIPARVTREVIEPILHEIDKKTGQENDARYWGYMICYILEQAGAWKNPAATLEDLAKLTRGLN